MQKENCYATRNLHQKNVRAFEQGLLAKARVLVIPEKGPYAFPIEDLVAQAGVRGRNIFSVTSQWAWAAFDRFEPDIIFVNEKFVDHNRNVVRWDHGLAYLIQARPHARFFVISQDKLKDHQKPGNMLLHLGTYQWVPEEAIEKDKSVIRTGMLRILGERVNQDMYERMMRDIRSRQ